MDNYNAEHKPVEQFHDKGYKKLFSHPKMVEDLIKSFVNEDFVKEFDFSTLRRYPNSFVTEEFERRESDIIWEVDVKGSLTFIYILIEFQSTDDRFMALRMLSYMLLFYQDLIQNEEIRKRDKLPSIFPILLYNGDQRWTAATSIEDLIEQPFLSFKPYIPHFSFFKIAENEFSEAALKELDSINAGIFLIETTPIENIQDVIDRFLEVYRRETDRELRRLLGLWIREKARPIHLDLEGIDFESGEVKPMLETRLREYAEKLEMKGAKKRDIEIARKMKEAGVEMETILKVTGLKEEDIKE